MRIIILILAAASLAACSSNAPEIDTAALEDSKYGRAGAEIAGLAEGAKNYQVKNRRWPTDFDELAKMTDSSFNRDDPWGHPYSMTETKGTFEIRSMGKDGEADTLDDIYWDKRMGLFNPRAHD